MGGTRRSFGTAAVGNAQGNRGSVQTEVGLRFPSRNAREERGARWKDDALLESVVCARGKRMMVSTSAGSVIPAHQQCCASA